MCIRDRAEVVLTPGAEGMSGAIKKAEETAAATPNSFIPQQFSNSDNALAHYKTTGPEIWRDTDGNIAVSYTHLDVYKRQPHPPWCSPCAQGLKIHR